MPEWCSQAFDNIFFNLGKTLEKSSRFIAALTNGMYAGTQKVTLYSYMYVNSLHFVKIGVEVQL